MNSRNSKSHRVESNLLQQNCYVRDVVRAVDLNTDSSKNISYYSLDEIQEDDGIKFKKNLYDYPITPDYVKSFADSSDYRRDPANAVANGVNKVNIPDCASIQKIMNMDSVSLSALYSQLQSKFSSASASVSSKSSDSEGNSNV